MFEEGNTPMEAVTVDRSPHRPLVVVERYFVCIHGDPKHFIGDRDTGVANFSSYREAVDVGIERARCEGIGFAFTIEKRFVRWD